MYNEEEKVQLRRNSNPQPVANEVPNDAIGILVLAFIVIVGIHVVF
jgi:hypothetical protein